MAVKLSLPSVESRADPAVEVRAVYVEEWIDGLAYANPPLLLEQTIESVERLNRQPMKPALRLALLDLHLRPYAFALDFRRAQGPAGSSAALGRQRAVSRRLRLCATSLALGYKQALSEVANRGTRFGAGRDQRSALQRSALLCSLALLHCYDEYRPTVPRLWLEAIALFRFAARCAVHDAAIPAPVDDPLFGQSVADLFKRLCLTSLVDPYHLAYGDLWTVYACFARHAPAAEIGPVGPVARLAGIFVVDPARDGKPVALSQLDGTPTEHCRLLDASPVLEALRSPAAYGDAPPASHVHAAMLRALGLPPKRHTPRESAEGRVRVAAGLSTVHHFLGGGALDDRPVRAGEDEIEIRADVGAGDDRGPSYRHESWTIADEGPGGVGIAHAGPPASPLGVGDLVGLQFPLRGDAPTDWALGVVRWLNIGADDTHLAGVQLLPGEAVPVMAQSETVTETLTRIPRPALALPAIGSARPGATLVTPRGLFAEGNLLRVDDGERRWLIEAQSRADGTAAFDRFGYRLVERD